MTDKNTEKNSGAPTVLIAGASRGLGLGLVNEYLNRGWRVIATVRPGRSTAVFDPFKSQFGDRIQIDYVDINLPDTVAALKKNLQPDSLDLLFINAGVSRGPKENISEITTEDFMDMMVTNALSPMRAITALLPAVKPGGTVGVMSSNLGSIANNVVGGWETYRASKASLNTLMRSFIVRQADEGRTYMCISPGWVKTDMGGEDAPLDVETSVAGIASTITARTGTGGVHYVNYENEPIQW